METNRIRDFEQKLPLSGLQPFYVVIKADLGLFPFSLYQRFEKRKNSKILYSPETIKIRFISRQNPVDFGGRNSPARQLAGGAETSSIENENQIFPQNPKFAMLSIAPESKLNQTFTIILPNLIHKSKKRNLT